MGSTENFRCWYSVVNVLNTPTSCQLHSMLKERTPYIGTESVFRETLTSLMLWLEGGTSLGKSLRLSQ